MAWWIVLMVLMKWAVDRPIPHPRHPRKLRRTFRQVAQKISLNVEMDIASGSLGCVILLLTVMSKKMKPTVQLSLVLVTISDAFTVLAAFPELLCAIT